MGLGGHDAQIDRERELDVRSHEPEVEPVGMLQPGLHRPHGNRLAAVDVPAKRGIGTEILVRLDDVAVGRRVEQFFEFGANAQVPEIFVRRQAPDKFQSRPLEVVGDFVEVERVPVLVEILVSEIPRILLHEHLYFFGNHRIVFKVLSFVVADVLQVLQCFRDSLEAVACAAKGVLLQDGTDRLQGGPAGHGVVADQEQPLLGEMLLGDLDNVFSDSGRDPAIHAVQGDKVKLADVVG